MNNKPGSEELGKKLTVLLTGANRQVATTSSKEPCPDLVA